MIDLIIIKNYPKRGNKLLNGERHSTEVIYSTLEK